MIKDTNKLKALIKNLAKEKHANAQILLRCYMMERFLERISLSEYSHCLILKGGMLIAALIGIDFRSTMDIDTTVKGLPLNTMQIEPIVASITSITEIMDEAEYPGVRVSLKASMDGIKIPLKIDISTDDAITPREVAFTYQLMLEQRTINLLAYNLESIFAEKLETAISRHITNTRMRDFYDMHMLLQLHGEQINQQYLRNALLATARKRNTEALLLTAKDAINEIKNDTTMKTLWKAYQNKFSYAQNIAWEEAIASTLTILKKCNL